MNQISGCRPPPGKDVLLAGALFVATITLAALSGGRATAQDFRSGLSSDLPPRADSTFQAGQTPLSPDQLAPNAPDPYAIADEVGPFEPGMGWTCGGSCPPSWRGRAEWLNFTRNRGNDSLSNGFRFDNIFDYQQAGRFTLDRRYDCTHGWEIVYAGPFNFHEDGVATAPGTLNADLVAGAGVNLSAFFNANLQRQRYDSRLQSVEVGYKSWGWNVIAVSMGGRYLNLNDRLLFRSVVANNDVGFLQVNTNNEVVLGQFGLDMFLPLGRWSFDTTWKGALGATVGSSDVLVRNAGINQINRTDQGVEFAALVEGGTFLRYFVTQRLSARAGYEFWWIHGVGLASRQFGSTISNRVGREFRGTNEIFFYGASAGLEYVW